MNFSFSRIFISRKDTCKMVRFSNNVNHFIWCTRLQINWLNKWLSLHLRHDSYQYSFHQLRLSSAQYNLKAQNWSLKHHSFHFYFHQNSTRWEYIGSVIEECNDSVLPGEIRIFMEMPAGHHINLTLLLFLKVHWRAWTVRVKICGIVDIKYGRPWS